MKSSIRKHSIAAIEGEMSNLSSRRETLERRRADAVATLETARATRKNALASDPAADLTELTRAVRDGEDEIATVDGVLKDLGDQFAEHEQRLAGAKDVETRAAAAKTLQDVSAAVDQAAAKMEEALKPVQAAYDQLIAAIPDTLVVVQIDGVVRADPSYPPNVLERREFRENALPNDLARAVLAEGVANVCPTAFGRNGAFSSSFLSLDRVSELAGERPSSEFRDFAATGQFVSSREAARMLISDRLRRRADAIVAGEATPDLSDLEPYRVAKLPPPSPRDVQVFATENFSFRLNERNAVQVIGKQWAHNIPEDAADAAVAASVALRTDTAAGARAFQEQKTRRAQSPGSHFSGAVGISDCVSLGVIRKPAAPAEQASEAA